MIKEQLSVYQDFHRSFEAMHRKLRQAVEQSSFFLMGKDGYQEDAVQEVFLKLWMKWDGLKDMSEQELKDYVFIVLRNYISNERRKNKRPKWNEIDFLKRYSNTFPGHYVQEDILVKEGILIYQRAVERLPKRERMVYIYHQHDYSVDDIAEKLNRSRSTVHNQLTSAYKSVKVYLNKSYGFNLNGGRRARIKSVELN